MPTDYAKLDVRAVYSKNSDYSSPKLRTLLDTYTLTPDEYQHLEVNVDTSTTVQFGQFTGGITLLIVKNNHATVSLNCIIQNNEGTPVTHTTIIPPGGMFVTPDVRYVGNMGLTAASAVECEIIIMGT